MSIKFVFIAMFALVLEAEAMAQLVCESGDVRVQIQQRDGRFFVEMVDTKIQNLMTEESLARQFPSMNPEFRRRLLEQAQSQGGGRANLGECGSFDQCRFDAIGSEILASCEKGNQERSARFEMFLNGSVYNLRCVEQGPFQQSFGPGVQVQGTGQRTRTMQNPFPVSGCRFL